MILVITFISIFLHSVTSSMPICPQNFSCPDFGPFSFPFYNTADTQCGFIRVDCNNESIELGGHSYEITGKDSHGAVVNIQNSTFQKLVKAKSCEALENNFTSTLQSFSISINPFIILFKCPKDLDYGTELDQSNYTSYNICKDVYLYHKHPISPMLLLSYLPQRCQVIQLPGSVQMNGQVTNNTDIFSLLTSQFSIKFWSLYCDECHRKGGHCRPNHENVQCLYGKKGKQDEKLILVIVLAGSAFIFMLSMAVFTITRRYKHNLFSYFLSKDKSPNPEDRSFFFGISVFSCSELEDATKNFDPSQELGDGGFGAVYYGKLQDGREVAVKRLYDHNYKRVQYFMNEVEILTKLRHPHLVLLYGCTSRHSQELLLVYEYIPNGTVADHLHGEHANPGLLTWPIRMKIAIETASALVYLHASEIIHRDVKTNNILLDHNFSVKVADFGLSRLIPNNVTHVSTAPQGTPGYLDPQYHQRYQLTDKSDVYSFGVVLIELISSMAAVDLNRSQDEISLANLALNRIQRCAIDQLIDPELGFSLNPEIKNMITSVAELAFRCLQFDSDMRPTMNEVLDVLMEIEAERITDGSDSISDLETVNPPPPSEVSDSVFLLKDFPPSPVSINVTSEWQSDSSASTTVSSNGDRLSMKMVSVTI